MDGTSEQHARRKQQIEISKELMVEALRKVPNGPARTRNRQLRKLVAQYRADLENCNNEIPYSLARFGLRDRMSFNDFIYAVTYDL